MHARVIFQSNFRLPKKVCILAPGPNGREHYGRIPPDYLVMAVSKAVMIEEVPRKAIWVMCHADQEWFTKGDARFQGVRIFGHVACLEAERRENSAGVDYYFKASDGPLEPETIDQVHGAVCLGTTVSGCALQLAYNFGTRQVLLCGVDMSGDGYWDGTRNKQGSHGGVWHAVRRMNLLIRWMEEERGVRIASLSQTTLQVRAYQSAEAEPP